MVPVVAKRSHAVSFPDEIADTHPHSLHHQTVADISYEDELEKINSELQVAWNKSLEPAYLATATAYNRVEVLMLSWEEDHDDLKVSEEMDELQSVFEHTYSFNVTREKIYSHNKKVKRPQTQMNKIVSAWVYQHEAERTLLIVYFAGHGERGDKRTPGKLVLDGRQNSRHDLARYRNTVEWDRTEHNLLNIGSDVLQIFDCCFAGAAHGNRGGVSQICEYLAACDESTRTRAPSKESFTRALIWALKELKNRRFTTSHLVNKIREAPNFPAKQRPRLLKRRHNPELHDNERLVLHPLIDKFRDGSDGQQIFRKESKNNFRQDVVTLKLVFESRPGPADITRLAEGFGPLVQGKNLDISSIVLCGLHPREDGTAVFTNPMFIKAIRRFKSLIRKVDIADPEGFVDELQQIADDAKQVEQHRSKKVRVDVQQK